jgi:hypothetical protein
MAGGIKYNIGLRQLKKITGKKKRARGFVPFDKAQNILLAWDEYQTAENSEKKAIDTFVEFLQTSGKDVTKAIYYHKRKQDKIPAPPDEKTVHISKLDFNVLGFPKSAPIKKLMSEPYDYFINLNLDGRLPLKSIAGFTQATCRIGFNRPKSFEFYDLILGNPDIQDIHKFIIDLKYYLLKIG